MTAPSTTDAELVRASLDGDEEAFRALVLRHLDAVFEFLRRYLADAADAEDVTQEAILKAWKALRRFDTSRNFRTWLFAIARNTALDLLKKRRSAVFSDFDDHEGGNALLETLEDAAPLPDALAASAEDAARLEGALAMLPPDRRAAILLHERDGLTFEEIAVIMKKPMNTVKSWHRRGLSVLRGLLAAPKDPPSA